MRATIIVDDNNVLVDGEPHAVNCAELADRDIHAVQWDGDRGRGEIEYKTDHDQDPPHRRPNERITNFAPFNHFVEAWRVRKQIDDAERKDALKRLPGI
jgi:hypothetical protein